MSSRAKVYPLKFRPRFVEKIWGGRKLETVLGKELPAGKLIGESWELYDFPPGVVEESDQWISGEIANGAFAGKTLHWAVGELGADLYGSVSLSGQHGQFPILIKFLDAREDLSVQVHPDQAYAAVNPGAHLKTEAWYVLQADSGSRLLNGLRSQVTREVFERGIREGTVERLIEAVRAKPGDCFYLPSGTVHALGAGILVAEVQTPSDTTFRVYDFGRIEPATGKPRTLHVEEALKCIDFAAGGVIGAVDLGASQLVESPFFKLHRWERSRGVQELEEERPVVLIVVEGEGFVRTGDDAVAVKAGEVVLMPAAGRGPRVQTDQNMTWLEVTFPS
jgi:mannose-6-phosphate isomerase